MSISHDELKRAQQIARNLRITQEREDEINPHPEELHRTAEKAARLIEEWALRLEWQQRDLERMRLLTRDHASQSWANSCIHDVEELVQKVQQLERDNAELRKALYAQADYQRELRADRDRLDWLEVHGEPVTYEEAPHELVWCVIGERGQRSIRAAIDAARAEETQS